MLDVGVFVEGGIELPLKGITEKFLLTFTEAVLTSAGCDNVSVSVIITDNEYIQRINSEYRGKDSPTDVISFAWRDEPFPMAVSPVEELGDIYISLDKAEEQAFDFGVTIDDEMRRLIIHGILHLIGYDHEISPEEEKRMNDQEERIFDELSSGGKDACHG